MLHPGTHQRAIPSLSASIKDGKGRQEIGETLRGLPGGLNSVKNCIPEQKIIEAARLHGAGPLYKHFFQAATRWSCNCLAETLAGFSARTLSRWARASSIRLRVMRQPAKEIRTSSLLLLKERAASR